MSTRVHTALFALLAIALLAWFLRGANLGAVVGHVRTARIDLLLVGLLCVAITYWTRTIRWRHLLAPLGTTTFRTTFRVNVIGFAALSLLPARAGDLVRPYMLARRESLSVPATFATVILERVLDLVAVLALLAIYVWGSDHARHLPEHLRRPVELSAAIAATAAAVLMAVMWILATHPERIGAVVLSAGRVLPGGAATRLSELATTFSGGFAAARSPRELAHALLWSFPLWVAIAGEAWAVTRALGIEMSFIGSFLVQALLVIGVAVPTPGGVGGFHAMYRFGVTTFFGAPDDLAVAAAIVLHALSFIPVILFGVIFMLQDGMTLGGLRQLATEAREEELPHGAAPHVARPAEPPRG